MGQAGRRAPLRHAQLPFFTYGIALGDGVATDEQHVLSRVVRPSGHRLLRMAIERAAPACTRSSTSANEQGLLHQWRGLGYGAIDRSATSRDSRTGSMHVSMPAAVRGSLRTLPLRGTTSSRQAPTRLFTRAATSCALRAERKRRCSRSCVARRLPLPGESETLREPVAWLLRCMECGGGRYALSLAALERSALLSSRST